MSTLGFFGLVCGAIVPLICVLGSVVLLIVKVVERKEEKKKEDLNKYKKY